MPTAIVSASVIVSSVAASILPPFRASVAAVVTFVKIPAAVIVVVRVSIVIVTRPVKFSWPFIGPVVIELRLISTAWPFLLAVIIPVIFIET